MSLLRQKSHRRSARSDKSNDPLFSAGLFAANSDPRHHPDQQLELGRILIAKSALGSFSSRLVVGRELTGRCGRETIEPLRFTLLFYTIGIR